MVPRTAEVPPVGSFGDSCGILPDGYTSPVDYFHDVVEFLSKYSWIYNFQVTRFFVDGTYKFIPEDWLHALLSLTNDELNQLPFGLCKKTFPRSLTRFLQKCCKFQLAFLGCDSGISACDVCCCQHLKSSSTFVAQENRLVINIPNTVLRGMTAKKQHEVQQLSKIIGAECGRRGCDIVVDVGAGMGYLDQVLHHNFGFPILAVESEEQRSCAAKKRSDELVCSYGIQHINLTLDDSFESQKKFTQGLSQISSTDCLCKQAASSLNIVSEYGNSKYQHEEFSNSGKACLIGLHSCGDLTPTMLKLFTNNSKFQSMVALSCCYHKMSQKDQHQYSNFPMSAALQSTLNEETRLCFSQFLLRLGAQETRSRWQQTEEVHQQHMRACGYRAILEVYINQENLKLSKEKRHAVRKSFTSSFDEYVSSVLQRYSLPGHPDEHRSKLYALYSELKHLFPVIEVFTGLQVCLQGVIEHLILIDRAEYLRQGDCSVDLKKVFNDSVSPRCIALVAHK